jgi:hypothetical protein
MGVVLFMQSTIWSGVGLNPTPTSDYDVLSKQRDEVDFDQRTTGEFGDGYS